MNEYDGFVAVDDVHVRGKLTLGENTADNGGLHIAHMALLDVLANHAGEADRRVHTRSALLRGLGAGMVRERASGICPHDGAGERALTRQVPGQWRGGQYAGVPEGVQLQTRCADDSQANVQNLVRTWGQGTSGQWLVASG